MTDFDRLHPAVCHHIVNSLGWDDLRPFQAAVIAPILSGGDNLVIAPTAGGKTEAALFPVLSRLLESDWRRLSILYICPIKALLNDLDHRLSRYFGLFGRRSALWHGDVAPSVRKRLQREPPDCLLTTPESLEVILTSKTVDHRAFLADVRVAIIDEIHAFAGDDRGWHLLAVLERISRIAGREVQRIGLSATVGRPDSLARWLRGGAGGACSVEAPSGETVDPADVTVDYVGSIENAAVVISRLHRGEKRLVFTDSRSKAERLGAALRRHGAEVFVTHGSLSPDERRRAERAFAARTDCVIVATSVLELGIDVGDLDRTIQIDAPSTVSSFLQRMGRTGRRAGMGRNMLFLALSDESLLRAAALVRLWEAGYVEPLTPPPLPYQVFSQQLMALALQEGGIGAEAWRGWIRGFCATAGLDPERIREIIRFMVETDLLWPEAGILWFGRKGEETFGHRHFMAVLSMVAGEPLFTVRHGGETLGSIHPLAFMPTAGKDPVILLAGRSWAVREIDWNRRVVHVESVSRPGTARWLGQGPAMGARLAGAIRDLIGSDEGSPRWSRRAKEKMAELRETVAWVESHRTVVHSGPGGTRWWTFAGDRANRVLGHLLKSALGIDARPGGLYLTFGETPAPATADRLPEALRDAWAAGISPPLDDDWLEGLKFSQCLPRKISREILEARLADPETVSKVLAQEVKWVREG